METRVALLRGINVGRAKRVAMADLRALFEELGFGGARTVLNSGNVIFECAKTPKGDLAPPIERAIAGRFGFSASVVVVSADTLRSVIRENPLARAADQPSRFLVAFVANPAMLEKTRPMVATSWGREAFALGSDAAYLWCPDGSIESKVLKEFSRLTGAGATTRNWATVLRLQAALQAS